MTIIISKKEVKEFLKLKLLGQISPIKERISFYEKKYHKNFKDFEKTINKSKKEDFDAWDDYIEWKAYTQTLRTLEKKLEEIEKAEDIRLT